MIMPDMRPMFLRRRWLPAFLTLLVWAGLAASLVFWWSHLGRLQENHHGPTAGTALAQEDVSAPTLARALGAGLLPDAVPVSGHDASDDAAGRFKLLGLLVHGQAGAALIAADQQPARPVRLGEALAKPHEDWQLTALTAHEATLTSGAQRLTLSLPPMQERSSAGDAVASPAAAGQVATPAPAAPIAVPAATAAQGAALRPRVVSPRSRP